MPPMQRPELPIIIQGGMGVAVSDWRLARSVAKLGQMGVVSGTALDVVLVRRLQAGDIGGHIRRAAAHFPVPGVVKRVFDKYFNPSGIKERFKSHPMGRLKPSRNLLDLQVLSNFVEVFLAKEGHNGMVGINLLTKVQAPTIPSLYGAMLAGVDAVLMGAGIPKEIPGVLDKLSSGLPAKLKLDVKGAKSDKPFWLRFDPAEFCGGKAIKPKRPKFFPIISSAVLAKMFSKSENGPVDGFIIEGPTAGGHNAPPRGKLKLTEAGEPLYGEKDVADLEAIAEVGLPFWLAGSYAEPERVVEALEAGAAGVQVGTAFAYAEESGFSPEIKAEVLARSKAGTAEVFTDPLASPTGFPFKVVSVEDSMSEQNVYEKRERVCDLGYLRTAYRIDDEKVGWRCASEPVQDFVRKGGDESETAGRKCVCNALMASIDLGQTQKNGELELPLVTSGDDVANVARFLKPGADTYTAADVVDYLLRDVVAQ